MNADGAETAMLTVELDGTLTTEPVSRVSGNGSTFATTQIRAAGADGETIRCSVIAFDGDPVAALLALRAGDAAAIAGTASLSHWQTSSGVHRVGLRIVVAHVGPAG